MYVISFVVWNVMPNLLFWGAIVVCLSVLLRIRILVVLLTLGALMGSVWLAEQIPVSTSGEFVAVRGKYLVPVGSRASFRDSYDCWK